MKQKNKEINSEKTEEFTETEQEEATGDEQILQDKIEAEEIGN